MSADANPVHIGRIVDRSPHWTWLQLDRTPELRSGDVIRVRPVNEDYPFRAGECRVLGVMGFCVHVERPAWADIAAIADMDHVYLTERGRPYAPGEKMTDRHPDSVIAQVVEETIEEAWQRFDREYPQPQRGPAVGDRIRWWPHVTILGTPAKDASWSDGEVLEVRDGYVTRIRIVSHGPNRWSSRDGLVGDERHVVGTCIRWIPVPAVGYRIGVDEMQAETPRVVTTCPGYDAVFHIDPDPPDLAQRQAARVAEHQRREQERGPFDYDVPDYSGILKAPYEQPARPDGFDQRQVDAAKAALLAPVPPRYPRRPR